MLIPPACPPAYSHQPRLLTADEAAGITRQCIRVVYPDDQTPVAMHAES